MNKSFVAYFKNEDKIVIVKVKVSHNLERTDSRAYILIDLQTGTGLKIRFHNLSNTCHAKSTSIETFLSRYKANKAEVVSDVLKLCND